MNGTTQQFGKTTQTILDQVSLHYLAGRSQYDPQAEPADNQNDLLSLFIQRELADVTSGYADSQMSAATQVGIRALRNADIELGDVIDAISTLPSSEPLQKALSRADMAYHGGEAQLALDKKPGHRGDTLADFIATTIRKTWYSAGEQRAVEACIHSLDRARAILDCCIDGLETMAPADTLNQASSPKA